GRYSFPSFQREGIERPRVRRDGRLEEVSYEEAMAAAAQSLRRAGPATAGWASPAATNEALFLSQRPLRQLLPPPHPDPARAASRQGKLARKVKGSVRCSLVPDGPNGRGATDLGFDPGHGPGYASLDGKAGRPRPDWEAAGVRALYLFEASPLHDFQASGEER